MRHPDLAHKLRTQPTTAERYLWGRLRRDALGVHFVRQYQFGRYYLDFACRDLRLAVEVDGGQHAESTTDAERTRFLEDCGWRVLRFWNSQVLRELDAVTDEIMRVVAELRARTSA